jgi:hypothetical protein
MMSWNNPMDLTAHERAMTEFDELATKSPRDGLIALTLMSLLHAKRKNVTDSHFDDLATECILAIRYQSESELADFLRKLFAEGTEETFTRQELISTLDYLRSYQHAADSKKLVDLIGSSSDAPK